MCMSAKKNKCQFHLKEKERGGDLKRKPSTSEAAKLASGGCWPSKKMASVVRGVRGLERFMHRLRWTVAHSAKRLVLREQGRELLSEVRKTSQLSK